MFLATASFPTGDHTFVVALDVPSAAEMEPFAAQAKPIIDSLRWPKTYTDN